MVHSGGKASDSFCPVSFQISDSNSEWRAHPGWRKKEKCPQEHILRLQGKSAWHMWGNEHNSGWAESEEGITSPNDRLCLDIFLRSVSSH